MFLLTPISLDNMPTSDPIDEKKEENVTDDEALIVPNKCYGELDVHAGALTSQCS